MSLVDKRGRLFGLLNVLDLLMVLLVALVVAAAYVKLSPVHRPAPHTLLPENCVWADVVLRMPGEYAWMAEITAPGMLRRDPRSGEVDAEITGEQVLENGDLAVSLRMLAAKDAQGRLVADGQALLPGRYMRIITENCVLSGMVYRVSLAEGPAP